MIGYIYAFNIEVRDDEVFFLFPSFPEIISAVPSDTYASWDEEMIHAHAEDAVITALQGVIAGRDEVPAPDDRRLSASGHVSLTPTQAMKLQLFGVYKTNCLTVADFARRIGKQDTTARRLLDLRHRSANGELIEAMGALNGEFLHQWDTKVMASGVPALTEVSEAT